MTLLPPAARARAVVRARAAARRDRAPSCAALTSRSAALSLVLECAFALLLALLLVPWGGLPTALWWPVAALVVAGIGGAALRWPDLPWTPPGRRPSAAWLGLAANAGATVLLGVLVLG